MPSLTNGEIQKALKRVKKTGKQETLLDGEGRGTGRLTLVLKAMPTRVTADWMAQQWRDNKRIKKKLGSYPAMSLALARDFPARLRWHDSEGTRHQDRGTHTARDRGRPF